MELVTFQPIISIIPTRRLCDRSFVCIYNMYVCMRKILSDLTELTSASKSSRGRNLVTIA